MEYLEFSISDNIATITLNRPDQHNAFNIQFIQEIISALEECSSNDNFHCLIIKANGPNFSAGADLHWMQNSIDSSKDENTSDALLLAKLMHTIYSFNRPTIAIANGKTFGGGIGIIACCDIAISDSNSVFCFSEARLGLIPAVISPYIVKAMGQRITKQLFLTAEVFNSQYALDSGLINYLTDDIDTCLKNITSNIKKCSKTALSSIKELFLEHDLNHITPELSEKLANVIANIRISKEAQYGLKEFLNKKVPNWLKD